ncbi:efflux RND transporter periplasmic adaptor subunit [Desulfohalovibrio reitneri]|uniref:efflux RND transporter periplasmic adaptor subunit n=1 Tax=Desulfohalovibrio reitneri TaxID=1307759 RepID=UPI0004A776D5|nr:efflux RND transporter periplasmic adaptor subunit [Desulfohalovibrio reitneri]
MTDSQESPQPEGPRPGWRVTLLACCLVLLAGAGVTVWIFNTEPTASRIEQTRETAMLVEVVRAERGDFRPVVEAMGTVRPARDVILRPRVEGQIVERTGAFTPGGFVERDEALLRIDPDDYRNALRQRRSELRRAESALRLEMGQQTVARKEFQLLRENLSGEEKALVLREPQLRSARAEVESARAAVEQARLELDRTTIRAPFDAQVLTREADLGSQVEAGDALGRLVGLDTYWVEATVPLAKLRWIEFPDETGGGGAEVLVRDRLAWPEGVTRKGRIHKLVGELEDRTRLARVLLAVDDPLARLEENAGRPPLMIGAFVEASIQARRIEDVVRLDRDYLRPGDTVWVLRDGRLDIRRAGVAFRDAEYAYIRDGLEDDELVVTTSLATVAEGVPLRRKESRAGEAGEPGQ